MYHLSSIPLVRSNREHAPPVPRRVADGIASWRYHGLGGAGRGKAMGVVLIV